MIKVCFLSIAFPMNKEVIHRLRAEMIRLAEMDKHLEFWFSGCHDSFPKKAVQFIMELRDVLSASQIDIVAVSDPVYNEKWNIPDYDEAKNMNFNEEDIYNVMEQNRQQLNELLPAYEKITEIEIQKEEFEKTPKKSIKRYLYK